MSVGGGASTGPGLDPWPACRTATADITPEKALPLAGYVPRPGPSTSIATALEANVLLTAVGGVPLLIVALDTLFGSDALRDGLVCELLDELPGLVRERVQLIASHTHFAPSLDPRKPLLGVADPGYLSFCVRRIGDAVRTTLADTAREATRFETGRARCDENVHRRLRTWLRHSRSLRFRRAIAPAPDRRVAVDHDVRVLRLADASDRTLCLLWSWPCHAVSSGDPYAVSADFPGAVRERLRERHGAETPILYLPGFCGDIRPYSRRVRRSLAEWTWMPFARGFETPSTDAAHAGLCAAVGAAALEADATAKALAAPDAAGAASVTTAGAPLSELLDGLDPSDARRLERVAIGLPPLELALWNAEVCAGHARWPVPDGVFPSGCANAVYGYLPTDAQIAEGGYEVDGFAPLFGLGGRYRRAVDERVRSIAAGDV